MRLGERGDGITTDVVESKGSGNVRGENHDLGAAVAMELVRKWTQIRSECAKPNHGGRQETPKRILRQTYRLGSWDDGVLHPKGKSENICLETLGTRTWLPRYSS